jgi:hypothetical protein
VCPLQLLARHREYYRSAPDRIHRLSRWWHGNVFDLVRRLPCRLYRAVGVKDDASKVCLVQPGQVRCERWQTMRRLHAGEHLSPRGRTCIVFRRSAASGRSELGTLSSWKHRGEVGLLHHRPFEKCQYIAYSAYMDILLCFCPPF